MSAENDSFYEFVNTELPKRISTEDDPTSVAKGSIPVATGIGLGVTFESLDTLVSVRLVTARSLSISEEGTFVLPMKPLGGLVHDMALIQLNDGSYLEVIDVVVDTEGVCTIPAVDFNELREIAVNATVSFIGNLTEVPV